MKYINDFLIYNLLENTSNLQFIKKERKKGNKTDIYDVIKDGQVIGQIKWSSRIRSYGFLPSNDCDEQIREFIQKQMKKRKSK